MPKPVLPVVHRIAAASVFLALTFVAATGPYAQTAAPLTSSPASSSPELWAGDLASAGYRTPVDYGARS